MAFPAALTAVVLGALLLQPPMYEASAAIVVTQGRAEMPLAPTDAGQLFVERVSEEELNSELQILESRALTEAVLRRVGIDEDWTQERSWLARAKHGLEGVLGGPGVSDYEEAVLSFPRNRSLGVVPRSNVIEMGYKSEDPDFAQAVVQAMTDEYLEQRTEIYSSPRAAEFFNEQMTQAAERLELAERALEDFVGERDITFLRGEADSLSAQKQVRLSDLSSLERDLTEARSRVGELERQVATLEADLDREPERLATADRLKQDPRIEEVETGLVALELQRDELLQRYTPQSQPVQNVERQIALAEARLAELRASMEGINRTEVNPVHQDLKSRLLGARAELEGARSRYASLARERGSLERALDDVNDDAFQLERLRREVEVAEENFELYQKKYEEARISSAMDREKLISVSVAEPARRPLAPMKTGKTTKLALALVLGLFGGLALALFLERLDPTIRSAEDLEQLEVRLLAAVPEEGAS